MERHSSDEEPDAVARLAVGAPAQEEARSLPEADLQEQAAEAQMGLDAAVVPLVAEPLLAQVRQAEVEPLVLAQPGWLPSARLSAARRGLPRRG